MKHIEAFKNAERRLALREIEPGREDIGSITALMKETRTSVQPQLFCNFAE